jgi:hypothetical protein
MGTSRGVRALASSEERPGARGRRQGPRDAPGLFWCRRRRFKAEARYSPKTFGRGWGIGSWWSERGKTGGLREPGSEV